MMFPVLRVFLCGVYSYQSRVSSSQIIPVHCEVPMATLVPRGFIFINNKNNIIFTKILCSKIVMAMLAS